MNRQFNELSGLIERKSYPI
uniref:Uncharacterized protein n=1 Tax=Anguilla anguilla TaxID=7936 RepID=A0A0E9R178_ANGAN